MKHPSENTIHRIIEGLRGLELSKDQSQRIMDAVKAVTRCAGGCCK